MAIDIITSIVEAAETYDLTTLANVKLDLDIAAGNLFSTTADTASGNVLPFAGTYGISKGQSASGGNIAAGATVQLVGVNSVTLSAAVLGDVPEGAQILFGDDVSADVFLARAISLSSTAIQNYCGRKFAVETVQDQVNFLNGRDGWQNENGLSRLQLSKGPIVSVTSVVVDDAGTDVTLVEGVDFTIDAAKAQLIRTDAVTGRPIQWRSWQTTVVYVAGFAPLPADIDDACSRMTKKAFWARGRDPSIMETSQGMVGSTKYWVSTSPDGNIPPEISDILDKYRQIVFA